MTWNWISPHPVQVGKTASSLLIADVQIPGSAESLSLYLQVREKIRRGIVAGNFGPGTRLPSSRSIASDLKLSRNTVEAALEALVVEGLIVRHHGKGTFVAAVLPEHSLPPGPGTRIIKQPGNEPRLPDRGTAVAEFPHNPSHVLAAPFTPSLPTSELFPRAVWAQLMHKVLAAPGPDTWSYGASAGLPQLQSAIAAHVSATRAVQCTPEQVIVTTGCQQSISLAAAVLAGAGDQVWLEDPGFVPARETLRLAGLSVIPVSVDEQGLSVEVGKLKAPAAKLVYVTPSHQYPTGHEMSLERRQTLLDWVVDAESWVLEDDYDGDYRYEGRPLMALQGMCPERVLYMGSFSKTMFPALRIAYLVVPQPLVAHFSSAKHLFDGHTATHSQAALASFITEGHLARHIRATTAVYDRRRRAFLEAIMPLPPHVSLGPAKSGLNVSLRFTGNLVEEKVARLCKERGIRYGRLSRHCIEADVQGLVLGFGTCGERNMATFVGRLRTSIEQSLQRAA